MAEDEQSANSETPDTKSSTLNRMPESSSKSQSTPPSKSYSGLTNALNYLFEGRESTKLVTGLIEDLNSGKSFFTMGFRVLWFGIRHPVHTYNLMQMEKNKDAFNNPDFQKAILENPRTLKFIGKIGEKLPTIGRIMAKFGVEVFKEPEEGKKGGFLDKAGLELLSKTLQDERTQILLQNVALSTIETLLNRNKVVLSALKLMVEGKNVAEFFKAKGEVLKDYAVAAMQENKNLKDTLATYGLKSDDLKTLANIIPILLNEPQKLEKIYRQLSEGKTTEMVITLLDLVNTTTPTGIEIGKYIEANHKLFIGAFNEYAKTSNMATYGLGKEELEKIADIVPALLNKPAELKKIYNLMSEGKTTEMVNSILELAETTPKIAAYIEANQKLFIGAFNEYAKTKNMATYGLGKEELEKIADIVPALLNKPAELKKIYNLMSEGKTTEMVNSILELAETTPKIAAYIEANQKLFIGAFNEYAKTSNMATYGLGKEELEKIADIVPALLNKPAELRKIYNLMSEGKTVEMVNTILDMVATTPAIGNYVKENKALFTATFSQYAKNDPNLTSNLEKYGLKAEDIDKIANIVPILLDKPMELKKIYAMVNSGDYIGIAKAALIVAKDTPDIKEYFEKNQQLFSSVLEKVIAQSPALEGYNLSGKIYEIVPVLLKHPDKLVEMVELYEQGKTTDIGKVFLDLAKNDEKIQSYLTQNKIIIKGAINKAGLGGFEIDDKVLDIVDNLVKPQNLEQFPKLIELYNQGKWNDLVIETCKLIEKDPTFSTYLRDNQENFGKIVNAAISKMPEVQKYIGDADIGSLISSIIKDPKSIRQLVEGYETYQQTGSKVALAKAGVTFLKNKAFDSDFRAAAYNAVTGWAFGSGVNKQEIIEKITNELINRDGMQRINLSEFTKSFIDSAQIEDLTLKTKLQKAAAQNNLFDGVSFSGIDSTLRLTNLDINGNKFVGTKFDNVSFKDCKFTNVSFAGAKFSNNVDFAGSEIDGVTLQSMLPALKAGTISLNGAKVIGNLPLNMDLSNINLSGVDLSKVTEMKGANLAGTDLKNTILPDNREILAGTHNLKKADLSSEVLTDKMKRSQENMVISKVVANFQDILPEEKAVLEKKLHDLYNDNTKAGKEFRKAIEATPRDLENTKLPLDTSKYSHVADYKDKTANMLDLIYQNRKNPDNIANDITANVIADKITKKLFGEGSNRGQDGLAIRKMVTNSVENLINGNPEITHESILSNENLKDMIKLMTETVRSITQYTNLGLATGGIQLKPNAIDEKLTEKLASHIGDAVKFSREELVQMQAIAEGVGQNIFKSGAKTSRAKDVEYIFEGIKEMVGEIKAKHGGADISNLLENQKEEIVGKVDKGYFSNAYTGLTKVYQAITSYTAVGMAATGGVYLKEEVAKKPETLAEVKNEISAAIGDRLSLNLDVPLKNTNVAPKIEKSSGLKGIVQDNVDSIDHHVAKGHKIHSKPSLNASSQQKNKTELGM